MNQELPSSRSQFALMRTGNDSVRKSAQFSVKTSPTNDRSQEKSGVQNYLVFAIDAPLCYKSLLQKTHKIRTSDGKSEDSCRR